MTQKIIFADEPTGNLDTANGTVIVELLSDLVKSGKTVIMVTHNAEDAKLADVIIKLEDE